MKARYPLFLLVSLTACGGSDSDASKTPSPQPSASSAQAISTSTTPPPQPPATANATATPSAVASVAPPAAPPECPNGMVKVKGGKYELGIMKRKMDVHDLCVDKTEVTAAAYAECVKAGKCTDTQMSCGEGATYGVKGLENRPIVCVDFKQASSFCEYRNARLPTEEEWEWVARNGDEARKYAWGNDEPKDQACWSGSPEGARKQACDVGSFPAGNNPQGIEDLTGNVFEWTSSKADSAGTQMVCRGGSWKDGVSSQLAVSRPAGFKPAYRCAFGGMRCFTEPAH